MSRLSGVGARVVFLLALAIPLLLAQHVGAGVKGSQAAFAQGETRQPAAITGGWTTTGPRGGKAHALAVSPNFANDGVAFSGEWLTSYQSTESGLGVIRSEDGGRNWHVADEGTEDVDYSSAVHDYAFSPAFFTDETAFAATWGGLFKSVDGGDSWQWLEGAYEGPPGGYLAVAVAPDYATSEHVLAGTWGGLLRSEDGGLSWTQVPGITGTSDVAFSPAYGSDGVAFAASDGVYKSEDYGVTWQRALTDSVGTLAVSPDFAADETIFAAGGDALYMSADAGTTWISSTLTADAPWIQALAISPAFASDQTLFAGTTGGLYWSDDGGTSWQAVDAYADTAVTSLAISPEWPAQPTLLVGTAAGVYRLLSSDPTTGIVRQPTVGFVPLSTSSLAWSEAANFLLTGTSNHGVYGSEDGARSWSPRGLQAGHDYEAFIDVAISPNYDQDQTLYAAWSSGTGIGGSVYRTTDGGDTWDIVYTIDYIPDVELSPQYGTDQTLFAATNERQVVGSFDGGNTWEGIGTWPGNVRPGARAVALTPSYPTDGTLFAGTAQGFWRLPHGGNTWQAAASGLSGDYNVSSVAVSPAYAGEPLLLAIASWSDPDFTLHYAVFRSTDGGTNWSLSSDGLPDRPLADVTFSPDYAEDGTAYATAADGELYRSWDGGLTWHLAGVAPEGTILGEVAVMSPQHVAVATNVGVWRYGTVGAELIANGSFEMDAAWTMPATQYPAAYSEGQAYDGNRSARAGIIDGTNTFSYSSVFQTVEVPAWADRATLSFYLYPVSGELMQAAPDQILPRRSLSEEPSQPAQGDAQYVLIVDPDDDAILETLLWTLSDAQQWQGYSFDLSAYAGETINVHFEVHNDGAGGRTGMYVDDVSLAAYYPLSERILLPSVLR
ncbi:MAG: hypothetical protein R3248_07405 [Candidatus Promineifilaceae bacterium]|nr:hypothetical protein [Candidatus Promineifilaceae bacterium]